MHAQLVKVHAQLVKVNAQLVKVHAQLVKVHAQLVKVRALLQMCVHFNQISTVVLAVSGRICLNYSTLSANSRPHTWNY